MAEEVRESVMEEEEEEEDDGPPPGFQCIINPQPPQAETVEADDNEDEDEDEEGPPPGFDVVVPKPTPAASLPPPDIAKSPQHDEDDDVDVDDDEDGPPPGWEFSNLANAVPEPPSNEAEIEMESNEDLDEGPPPGWETVVPHQMPLSRTPPLQPPPTVSSDIDMGSRQSITRIDNEVSLPVLQCTSIQGHSFPAEPPIQKPQLSEMPSDTGNKEDIKSMWDKKPRVSQPTSPLQQLTPTRRPVASAQEKFYADKAQLVCGTCRKLCVYPRGTKWVRCPGCQEVNFVLEAHEVGQVNCGGCAVLLMYPHGAPSVQCSSCRAVTEIGAHNRRPPLSLQIEQARRRGHRTTRAR